MAREFKGILLNILAILRCTAGREMLATNRPFKQDHQQDDWILLIETLLQWEAYLNEPKMLRRHVNRLS